jgi:hypothetical protein
MQDKELLQKLSELIAQIQNEDEGYSADENHFKQIQDLHSDDCGCGCAGKEYSNTPEEKYADIDAVTDNAGGGVNGPKHPADLRTDQSHSLYNTLAQLEWERGKHSN